LAARRDAVRRALTCSGQLPDAGITSSTTTHTDFTAHSDDPPVSVQNESVSMEDAVGRMPSSSSFFVPMGSRRPTSTGRPVRTSSPTVASTLDTTSQRRTWFNAAAVLHDVRPSASYTRHPSPIRSNGSIHATVTVDGQRFEGFGDTWRTAKRSAAAQALCHILQLRHLTSDF